MRALLPFLAAAAFTLVAPCGAATVANDDQDCFGAYTFNAKGYGTRDLGAFRGSLRGQVIQRCGGRPSHTPSFDPPAFPHSGDDEGSKPSDDSGKTKTASTKSGLDEAEKQSLIVEPPDSDGPHQSPVEAPVTADPSNVPEPASLALLAGGLLLAGRALRRRTR